MNANTPSNSKIIQIDPAVIRTLASPKLAAAIKRDGEFQLKLVKEADQAMVRIEELKTRVAKLQAQEAQITAERNVASTKAENAQREMTEALAEGRDIADLRKAYSESLAQSIEAHGVLSSVEKALQPQRKELDELKAMLFGLRSNVSYAESVVAVRDCRLLLAEMVRQILEIYPAHVLSRVQDQMATLNIRFTSLPREDLSLPEDPRQALEREWAELDHMDQATVDGVKAFITDPGPVDALDGNGATVAGAGTDAALVEQVEFQVRSSRDGRQFVAPVQERIVTNAGSRKAHARDAKGQQPELPVDEPVIGADLPDSDE